ncbi:MAG: type II toxin-antitoxin system PemK/MazF family toxin [Thermomicrobiales bacterium]
MRTRPSRGEVWQVDLDPTRGHEQAGVRPAVIVSVDRFNHGPAGLVVVVPITRTERRNPFRVEVLAPEAGLTDRSFVKCEDVRSISLERLRRKRGDLALTTMDVIEDRLRILFGL